MKNFKDIEGFIENVGLCRSTIYFINALYKCLKKFPALKNSRLSSCYFRSNFKLIETVFKNNEELFLWEEELYKRFCLSLLFLTFSLFCYEKFSFDMRQFLSLWEILSFIMRRLLSSWDFLFRCETFFWRETLSFSVRLFFFCENFFYLKQKFSVNHTRRLWQAM